MVLLSPPDFLTQLENLFISTRSSGNITLTQKSYNGVDKPTPKPSPNKKRKVEAPPVANKVLIRAKTDKSKLATVVEEKDLVEFQVAYLVWGFKKLCKKWA